MCNPIILPGKGTRKMQEFNIKIFWRKYVYRYVCEAERRRRPFVVVPAALFSFFMVLGYSYSETDSWSLVFGAGIVPFLKACVKFAVFFALFYYVISFLYCKFDDITLSGPFSKVVRNDSKKHLFGRYIALVSRYPFRTSFLTLFIAYIPYIIVSYPAILMPDQVYQILDTYPNLEYIGIQYLKGHLLSDQIYLNTHHPIMHTLLLRAFLEIGTVVFHSFNVGLFLFATAQFLFVISAVSYGIRILVIRTPVPDKYIPFILLYYIISPNIQNYMFLLTKDVIYVVFVFYFTLSLYLVVTSSECRYRIMFVISGLGIVLFRNDGRYSLIIALSVLALLYRRQRKFLLKYLAGIVVFCLLFFRVLLPMYHVTPGSIREVLSVPFQQTARYIIEHGEDVTAEERTAIDTVLDYDHMIKFYNPHLSDNVKATYNENSTPDDLLRYFKVWFQMLRKHPDSYIQAYINNYYYYLYPGPILFYDYCYQPSERCMDLLNRVMAPLGADFHYPSSLYTARMQYELFREDYMYVPPVILLMYSPTYTWLLTLLLLYGIYKKIPQAIGLLVFPVLVVCMCMVSPCNGFYFRYLYPVIFIFPVLISLFFSAKRIAT